jgi:hypothetical protein
MNNTPTSSSDQQKPASNPQQTQGNPQQGEANPQQQQQQGGNKPSTEKPAGQPQQK